MIIDHDQIGFNPEMQGYFNIWKSIGLIHYLNKLKTEKTHDNLIGCCKGFDKSQHSFMLQVLERSGTQCLYLNIIKAIYSKPIVNIKLNGEKLKAVLLKSGTRQGCPFSPYLFSIVLNNLVRTIRQQKDIKGIQIRNEEVKISLFADDKIGCIINPQNLPESSYS